MTPPLEFLDARTQDELGAVKGALEQVGALYPGFDAWWREKAAAQVPSGNRMVMAAKRDGRIVAAVVAKRSPERAKICTLWVGVDDRGRGIGPKLLARAMAWCGDRTVTASVAHENLPRLAPILAWMGLDSTGKTVEYRMGVKEHFFERKANR